MVEVQVEPKLTGDLVFPKDRRYPVARRDLIQLYQSYPQVIVFVQDAVKDVRNAIAWAKYHNVSLRIRGGRCSVIGMSNLDNGIVCDISQLKKIKIDEKTCPATVHVGAGVTQGELTNFLSSTGFYTGLGNEPILGLIGVLLGGGIGLLSRHKGPGCDSLVEVTTVLANGCVVKANVEENEDLFWASRGGGGGNFGVVTSFKMKLYKAPPRVVVWEAIFPLSQFFLAYDTWQRWAPFVKDTRLSSNCSVFNDRVDIKGIFLGSEKELGNLLKPILMVPDGKFTQTELPFHEWFVSLPGTEQPFQKYTPLWVHKPFPPRALQVIYDHMLKAPSTQSNFFSLAWGGNTRKKPKGGTAFPSSHRKAIFYCEPGAEWSDSSITSQAFDWVSTFREALKPYFHGGYCNVLDAAIGRPGEEYYGRKNCIKLQQIKRKYDKANFFFFEQGIGTQTIKK